MLVYFLDVVEESWMQRNGRDVLILTLMALAALAIITGIIVWRKRKNKKQ